MKFCQGHWDQLKEAIAQRGLSQFIKKSGEEALKEMVGDLQGTNDAKQPYDPLMSAHWAISSRALECGGLYLMTGDYCPLCELEAKTPQRAANWINPCCDAILEDFIEKKWVGAPS